MVKMQVILLIFVVLVIAFCFFYLQDQVMPVVNFEVKPALTKADIAIVMVNVNDSRGPYSVPLWQRYCDIHGYDFIQLTNANSLNKSKLHPAWWKIPLCQSVLKTNKYRYIVHVDADTMPLRFNVPATNYIMDTKSIIYVCKEPPSVSSRQHFGAVNTGVFILKQDPLTTKFLDDIWSIRHKTAKIWPWEQGAIEEIMAVYIKKYPGSCNILEYGTMQSFFMESDGCDLLHLSKCDKSKMDPWVAHVIRVVHPNWEEIYKKYTITVQENM